MRDDRAAARRWQTGTVVRLEHLHLYGWDPTCDDDCRGRMEVAMHMDTFAILLGISLLAVAALIIIPLLLLYVRE
jgi:hypothetical protein